MLLLLTGTTTRIALACPTPIYYQNNLANSGGKKNKIITVAASYTSDEENHRVAKHSINFQNSLGKNSSTTNTTTRTKISKNKSY
jgi:hypothetical protein